MNSSEKKMKTSITHDKGRLDYKSVKWNDKKLTRSTTFNHAKAFRPKAIYLWNTWSATMTCKIYLPRFPTFLLDHRSPLLHNGAKAIIKSACHNQSSFDVTKLANFQMISVTGI